MLLLIPIPVERLDPGQWWLGVGLQSLRDAGPQAQLVPESHRGGRVGEPECLKREGSLAKVAEVC